MTAPAAGAEDASAAIKAEKSLKSEWRDAVPRRRDQPARECSFEGHDSLQAMYDYELSGTRTSSEPPAHIELMRRLELVDYEPASDPRQLPLVPERGAGQAAGGGARVVAPERSTARCSVETPIMYDYQHPNLMSYLNRFPARQYVLLSDTKEYFLRFAACFGQYLMQHDMQLSHRMLPSRLFEISHYSFRREQSGELAGLRRLRTFTMPDLHTLREGHVQAREEFLRQMDVSMQCMDDFGLDYEVAVRFVRELPGRGPGVRWRDRREGRAVRSSSRSGTSASSTSSPSSSSTSSTRRRSRRASPPFRSTWRTPSGSTSLRRRGRARRSTRS